MEEIITMKKILLSAFACDPTKGSEPGNGWNWAEGLSKRGYEVYCFTRIIGKNNIEGKEHSSNLNFVYVSLGKLESLYSKGTAGMYLYYLLWQWVAFRKAHRINKEVKADMAHHVTWGSIQMGSFFYRLKLPFIFGPAGGGQQAPVAFKQYFDENWASEQKREKISDLMVRYNPAFKKMIRKASAVLVSNTDTLNMVTAHGVARTELTLDAALPETFYPQTFIPKVTQRERLRLLWVGRFMPRKGLLLLMEVMRELRQHSGISLTVVGDGEIRDQFLDKIKEYELGNSVVWKGKVSYNEVREFYQTHDVFLFSSLRDSCPAQLIEAMAFGLPVITINLHGQALIVNDKTGIRCACDTPEIAIASLKEAVIHLAERPDLVNEMSINAHSFSLEQNWNSKIDKITQKYYPA